MGGSVCGPGEETAGLGGVSRAGLWGELLGNRQAVPTVNSRFTDALWARQPRARRAPR